MGSPAADTAMKALVQALKPEEADSDSPDATLLESQVSARAKHTPDDQLELPHDHQWKAWEESPGPLGGPKPSKEDIAAAPADVVGTASVPAQMPPSLRGKLPGSALSNKDAEKSASTILTSLEEQAREDDVH